MASKRNSSFKSFFSVPGASGSSARAGSRMPNSGNLVPQGTPPKPGWVGAVPDDAPSGSGSAAISSRGHSFSQDTDETLTPPRTPPLRRQTTVPAAGAEQTA